MSHRYRLYPTTEQAAVLREWCGQARFVWNQHVRVMSSWLDCPQARLSGEQLFWARMRADLGLIKGSEGLNRRLRAQHDWLEAGPSKAHLAAHGHFKTAFENWLNPRHPARRPRLKRRQAAGSFALPQHTDFAVTKLNAIWWAVAMPKQLGKGRGTAPVKFRCHRPLPVTLTSVTVSVSASGRWHISFTEPPRPRPLARRNVVLGVDFGVTDTLAVTNGQVGCLWSMPDLLTAGERRRLRMLERGAARQRTPKGQPMSNGWRATQRKIAVLREREARRRKDWIEQATTTLANAADVVVLENLRLKNMTRSAKGTVEQPGSNVAQKSGLNRALLDAAFGLFRQRLEQKGRETGVTVIRVDPRHTSQTCAECGHVDAASRRGKQFRCTSCGVIADADLNAAAVIRRRGTSSLGSGSSEQKPVLVQARSLAGGPVRTTGATQSQTLRGTVSSDFIASRREAGTTGLVEVA
ncbi:MAG: transposase [Rhodococcus sp.]|nr:transposase [Rhodococcus sp. (in: high G+C Gram-positive bacteria)]